MPCRRARWKCAERGCPLFNTTSVRAPGLGTAPDLQGCADCRAQVRLCGGYEIQLLSARGGHRQAGLHDHHLNVSTQDRRLLLDFVQLAGVADLEWADALPCLLS